MNQFEIKMEVLGENEMLAIVGGKTTTTTVTTVVPPPLQLLQSKPTL